MATSSAVAKARCRRSARRCSPASVDSKVMATFDSAVIGNDSDLGPPQGRKQTAGRRPASTTASRLAAHLRRGRRQPPLAALPQEAPYRESPPNGDLSQALRRRLRRFRGFVGRFGAAGRVGDAARADAVAGAGAAGCAGAADGAGGTAASIDLT